MPQQEPDLRRGQPKRIARNAFLVASLAEYPESPQPRVDASRPPPVAVAAQKQLVPVPATVIATHDHTERGTRRALDHSAILLRARCVTKRLAFQITAVADQLPEKHYVLVGPPRWLGRLGQRACGRDPITHDELLDTPPSV